MVPSYLASTIISQSDGEDWPMNPNPRKNWTESFIQEYDYWCRGITPPDYPTNNKIQCLDKAVSMHATLFGPCSIGLTP